MLRGAWPDADDVTVALLGRAAADLAPLGRLAKRLGGLEDEVALGWPGELEPAAGEVDGQRLWLDHQLAHLQLVERATGVADINASIGQYRWSPAGAAKDLGLGQLRETARRCLGDIKVPGAAEEDQLAVGCGDRGARDAAFRPLGFAGFHVDAANGVAALYAAVRAVQIIADHDAGVEVDAHVSVLPLGACAVAAELDQLAVAGVGGEENLAVVQHRIRGVDRGTRFKGL